MLLQDYINNVQEMLHDTSAVVWPLPRVITRINDARLDAARDMHCVRQNVTGIQLIPGQEIYNLNGAVAGANMISGGSNYTQATVTFGTAAQIAAAIQPALGTPVITNGVITSINMMQWGIGYQTQPTMIFGGNGSGASASSVVLFQQNPNATPANPIGQPLAITKISYIWNGERRAMKYANFTLFDAYARMWVQNFNAPPGIWTHHKQGQQVYIQPPPDQAYLSEWDIIFMPYQLINLSDFDANLIDPWCRAVQFKACEYLLYKLRNQGAVSDMGNEYYKYVPHVISTSGGIIIPNIYNRNFQRRMMR